MIAEFGDAGDFRRSSPPHHGIQPRQTNIKRSEEHTSELQSPCNLVCRLLLEKKKKHKQPHHSRKDNQILHQSQTPPIPIHHVCRHSTSFPDLFRAPAPPPTPPPTLAS